MSWASYMPKELLIQPLSLIVLTGLDVKRNAIHKEIADGFLTRSGSKYRYKLLDGDFEYPKCKQDRPLEFYVPKGILKTNWLNKHLNLIPSLVAVFFDLDWDEPNWKEKQMECATKIELVRHSLLDRNTRVILILIQKHPSPVGEDNALARERYPSLCTACNLKTGYLFLLHAEHLQGYIAKLEEDAFTEPTQSYYTLEIKAIKTKKDTLIKITHQYLFVRLAFKIAFFNEMKHEINKAIEYYKQAYLYLLDIRFYDTNILEIKMVAGIINFKICQLYFDIRHPIDAISQFRRHIDIFKNKLGSPDLEFEHSAWMSKQFQVLGELFEDAIKKNLVTAVQTQHPGFYFHPAANHAIQRCNNRKEFANKFIGVPKQTDLTSFVETLNHIEYYGQRPWRQGQQGMEILDPQKEREGILALQDLEMQQNLTPLITDLFKRAISHFKKYNCERMKQYLTVCMAEEYFKSKDYQEALKFYVNVLNDYKTEHWWPILTQVLSDALKCAYLVPDVTNYCLLCIELIGKNILLSNEDKSLIQSNLMKVLNNEIPIAEKLAPQHSINDAVLRWQNVLQSPDSIDSSKVIPVQVSGMVPFVECKVKFGSTIYNSNQPIELFVYIKTNCVDPISFNKLYVNFNIPTYNDYCVLDNCDQKLFFKPNEVNTYKFSFLCGRDDVGKDLEVSQINLELGNRDKRVLVFHWKGDCKNGLLLESTALYPTYKPNKKEDETQVSWDSIKVANTTQLTKRIANLDILIEHQQPVLVNEYYAVKVKLINRERFQIKNLELSVSYVYDELSEVAFLWLNKVDSSANVAQQTTIIPNINPGDEIVQMVYVQFIDLITKTLNLKINYESNIQIEENKFVICSCIKEQIVKLESIKPLLCDFSILSMQMKPLSFVHFGEPFLLICDIKNESQYSIKFKDSGLDKSSTVKFKQDVEMNSFLREETLKQNEKASECFCLVIDNQEAGVKSRQLGEYYFVWRRKQILDTNKETTISNDEVADENEDRIQENDKYQEFYVKTKVPLPEINLQPFPFYIETILPAFGYTDSYFTVINRIKNNSTKRLALECTLEDNEYFSIGGNKLQYIQIMPNDVFDVSYTAYPLQSGFSKLPSFHVKFNIAEQQQLDSQMNIDLLNIDLVVQRMLTNEIFIMPKKYQMFNESDTITTTTSDTQA